MVTEKPDALTTVGIPLINPVEELMLKPGGRPDALKVTAPAALAVTTVSW
jgi:hypothetical protein